MHATRRTFLKKLGLGAAALAAQPHVHGARRPNIVLIMADDLGLECLGAYGGESYDTPNLDRLAAEGMRFMHCYSTPKCVPSRVNILTGRYGFRTGQEWGFIPPDEVTFGHVLQKAGYATALAGKWQLALLKDDPQHVQKMGFEEDCCWAWHEGPRYWQPLIWQNGELRKDVEDRYGPEVFTEFLIDFMRENEARPFLAYYPMTLAHAAKSGGKYKEPKGPNGRYQSFAERVKRMDDMVGKIADAVDALGLAEDTLVLFTADNGSPQSVTSLRNGRKVEGGKGTLKDSGTHVPLIARQPGTVPRGAVCDGLVDFSDFLPTLGELAGAELPADRVIDGKSFTPLLDGCGETIREYAYTEWEGRAWVRGRRWKLYDDGELYDLEKDPLETAPIGRDAADARAKHARERLEEALKRIRNQGGGK